MIMTKIKLALFIIFCVILAGLFIFAKSDMANTADDFVNQSTLMNDNKGVNSKAQFDKQYNYQNSVNVAENSSGSGSSSGFNVNGDGQFISDTSVNTGNVPLYDGYTMDDKYESYDINYQKFFDGSYPNVNLHGLGDFTNKAAKNSVSYEFASDDPVSQKPPGSRFLRNNPTLKDMGGFWTVDGRLCVALPPGAIIDPAIYDPLIPTKWGNKSAYTSKQDGTDCLNYIPGIFDSSLTCGLYVDIILGDGTVLACIVTDTKALHSGTATNGDVCHDDLLEGYAHWRGFKNGNLSYVGIIEVCCTKEGKKASNFVSRLHLENNKIVGMKVYKGVNNLVNGSTTEFNNVFTGGN